MACVPLFNIPMTLTAGYLINLKNIFQQSPQKYFAWTMYFSPMHYSFTGMMVAQFPVENPDTPGVNYPLTDQILDQYGFTNNHFWGCFAMLTLLTILQRTLVVVSLVLQDLEFNIGSGDTRN